MNEEKTRKLSGIGEAITKIQMGSGYPIYAEIKAERDALRQRVVELESEIERLKELAE